MRILDLFSGAGGAAMGYHLAFPDAEIVGVDIVGQPRYPFTHVVADAMTYPLDGFDFVHASPPCQRYSVTRSLHSNEYPDLVAPTRARLSVAGVPFVIENVPGAPMADCVTLCGSSFGLGVWRHRLFELHGFDAWAPPTCRHALVPEPVDVTGTGGRRRGDRHAGGGNSRKPLNLAHARQVMGIDWMTRQELAEAIPPAYTEWIGGQLAAHLAVAS